MEAVLSNLRWVHVAAGFIGLAAFWVPIFTRKGAAQHKLFGKIFKYSAYIVLGAAGLAVCLHAINFSNHGMSISEHASDYGFMIFLGYLALVTFIILRHGQLVLQHKPGLASMNNWPNRFFAGLAIASSLMIIAFALVYNPSNKIILYALSPIGISSGIGIFKAIRGQRTEKKAWFYEHLGAMLGCGIAFHTAFAVFGASRIFDLGLSGAWSVLPWIAPTLIGIPATIIWTRHYKQRFNDF